MSGPLHITCDAPGDLSRPGQVWVYRLDVDGLWVEYTLHGGQSGVRVEVVDTNCASIEQARQTMACAWGLDSHRPTG